MAEQSSHRSHLFSPCDHLSSSRPQTAWSTSMQDADITIKPRDVMPAGATTLPAEFYTDQARFRVEMDRLFAQDWICAGRVEQVEAPGQFFLRELAGESIIITRSASGPRAGLLQRLPPSRHEAVHRGRGTLRRQHPVPVSRLDVRPRRTAGRRAAHGRGPALPQGGLSAPSRPRGRMGRPHLHDARAKRRGRSSISSPICRRKVHDRGACRISGSATASSTTCGRTGS